jgi:hypothetical protein
VRASKKRRLAVASAIAMGTLLAGCQSGIDGTPVTRPESPTEPSFPTSRPSRPTAAPPPTTIAPPSPGTPTAAPPGAEVLEPDNGYVFIETKSGKTRCQLSADDVGCESQFVNSPVIDGAPANGVHLTANGQIRWVVGNLGDIPAITLDYRTYRALGWTIEASSAGTRFTNDRSRHGMFVAVEGVRTF